MTERDAEMTLRPRGHRLTASLRRLLATLLALLLWAGGGAALAQAVQLPDITRQLDAAETDLRTVDRTLDGRVREEDRPLLRTRVTAARDSANAAAGQLDTLLARVDARVAGLGPETGGAPETAEIRAQRVRLTRERTAIDSAAKRGRLIGVEAQQLIDEIQRSQTEQFSARLSLRSPSPLTPDFWQAVIAAAPRDLRRIDLFAAEGVRHVGGRLRHRVPWPAIAGLVAALLIVWPGRVQARELGRRLLLKGTPGHRVRRSGYAIWRVAIGTLAPLLAVLALVQGLSWSDLAPQRWQGLTDGLIAAIGFAAFTVSVTGALLMRNRASWRLVPIADDTAARMRPYTLLLAGLSAASILLDAFNTGVGASGAARVASEAVEALLHLLLIGAALLAVGRLHAARADAGDGEDDAATGAAGNAHVELGAVTLTMWLMLAVALLALLLGYIGFSLFLVQLIAWGAVLGSATYLLMIALDDVSTSVFAQASPIGRALTRGLGLRGSAIDQFGVLLSGATRVATGLIALGLLLSPFGAGAGIGGFFGRLGGFAQGFEVGGVAVSPGAILRGLVVLFVGLAIVRAFLGWLNGRYLPVTDLDGSGRNSVSLVARYVGIGLAVIWALASLGIGVERIALLLSALSVGIGFGLQAITSNFVSGLILLAERPIKIGDLVRVGTDEGDVKRISVRSTEIELPDHSTLIVPNSELITKTVLNKTLANPLGRVQIQFTVPIDADTDRVRAIVMETFVAEPAILADPEPKAFIDSLTTDGRVAFNCLAHVASPRAAYAARSNVLIAVLRRLRAEGIEIGTLPQKLELTAPEGALRPPAAD